MRVIKRKTLQDYWQSEPGRGSERPLVAWYRVTKSSGWRTFSDVKGTFGHTADAVGDCVVFDIGNNRWRLITRLRYASRKVFVLQVLTHREYDTNRWKEECGCFAKPPQKSGVMKKARLQTPAVPPKPRTKRRK